MASTSPDKLTQAEYTQLCCTYATLLLHDEGLQITADRITKLLNESNNQIDSFIPTLFAQAVKHLNIGGLLGSIGSGTTSSGPAVEAPQEVTKEEEPAEEEEEDDDFEGALDMFGGDDDW